MLLDGKKYAEAKVSELTAIPKITPKTSDNNLANIGYPLPIAHPFPFLSGRAAGD